MRLQWRTLGAASIIFGFSFFSSQTLMTEEMRQRIVEQQQKRTKSEPSESLRVLNQHVGSLSSVENTEKILELVKEMKSWNATRGDYWIYGSQNNNHTLRGYHYALKTSPNHCTLCKSTSWNESYDCNGPILAPGLQPFFLLMIRQRYLIVGVELEGNVLMGSIDTHASNNWQDWRLLPGITLRKAPMVNDKNDTIANENHTVVPPRFFVLEESNDDHNTLSGYLVYPKDEEQQDAAASKLQVNLTQWLDVVVHNRNNRTALPSAVLGATSLHRDHVENNVRQTVLITGVGRSGTGVLCKVFQEVGLNISHDNDKDCGPYPGSDGAVSWYDAFRGPRQYDTVLHLVRDPLSVILSRSSTLLSSPGSIHFLRNTISRGGEKFSSQLQVNDTDSVVAMATKHWVRRNSFVEAHAEWRERTEDLATDPLALWQFCMASYFGERCPPPSKWKAARQKVLSHYTNSVEQRFKHAAKRAQYSWDEIAAISNETAAYVRIAQEMGFRYGYEQQGERVTYTCDFGPDKKWDCQLSGA